MRKIAANDMHIALVYIKFMERMNNNNHVSRLPELLCENQ